MTEKIRTLPTKEINKKWNDRIAKYINIHKGGDNWDWSEGCITIYKKDYDKFIGLFKINEIVNIEKI